MALVERLLGPVEGEGPRIPVDPCFAILAEVVRGQLTTVQAQAQLEVVCRGPGTIVAAVMTEFNSLIGTVPTGGATAQQLLRLFRLNEIRDVFILLDRRRGHDATLTAASIRTRLGLPAI